jgi:hypothetical protein
LLKNEDRIRTKNNHSLSFEIDSRGKEEIANGYSAKQYHDNELD